MRKKEMHNEKKALLIFFFIVVVICSIVFLRDPRIVSYATKEQSISLLNKQSYAAVGDGWVIKFKTEGRGALEISDIEDSFYDISPFELRCGNNLINYESGSGSLSVADYKCDEVSTLNTQIRSEGIQTLKIKFGNKVYPSNTAISKEKI